MKGTSSSLLRGIFLKNSNAEGNGWRERESEVWRERGCKWRWEKSDIWRTCTKLGKNCMKTLSSNLVSIFMKRFVHRKCVCACVTSMVGECEKCGRHNLVNWLTHFSHINFHAIDLANYPSTLTLKAIWQRMKTVLVSWQVTHLIDSIVRCKVREWGKRQRRQEQVKESEWRITKIRMITWKEIEEKETTERTHLTFNNAGIMSFSQVSEKRIPLFFDFRLSPVGPAGPGGRGWAGWAREGSHLYIYIGIPLSSLSIRPIGLVLNEHKFGPALGFE